MGEFTKEELEDFISWGEVYTEFGCSWADKVHRPLINKLQSMIDNYCEHVNAVIDERLKCIHCGAPSSLTVTKYQ